MIDKWNGIRLLVSGLLMLASGYIARAQMDVEALNKLYDEAWHFSQHGQMPADSASTYHGLPDMSLNSINNRRRYWESVEAKLQQVEKSTLTGDDLINFQVFSYVVEDKLAGFEYKAYLMPFDAEGGFHTAFGFVPLNIGFRTDEDYRKYIAKLIEFGRYTDQHIALLREGLKTGYTLQTAIMENFEETAQSYIVSDPEQSVFYRPFIDIPARITEREMIRQQGRIAIENSVLPAYRRLADFLRDEYVPGCRKTLGATDLPDGEAYYAQRVRHFTTLNMTPQEVYQTGLGEVARIRKEMQVILDSLNFDGTYEEFLHFLRSDPQFYASTPHELLAEASYFSKKIDGLLPAYFNKLPRLPYGVAPVPDEIAPRYTAGRYVPGSYEGHRAGTYWVNTYQLESRPLYVLPALTLHEAVPGHHLQISLDAERAQERKEPLPDFRGDYYISAFGEGWALYTEWLGKEMGVYEDLYQRFGALTYEMWRACRLVVDPGMHAMDWTREQAVEYMAGNTALSMHEVNTEINRYIGWPGQAVSYKIGELKIRELRKQAEEELGALFDLRAFHDKILQNGSVPLFVLESIIKDWIVNCAKSEEECKYNEKTN